MRDGIETARWSQVVDRGSFAKSDGGVGGAALVGRNAFETEKIRKAAFIDGFYRQPPKLRR
jgi:hypothetical protein